MSPRGRRATLAIFVATHLAASGCAERPPLVLESRHFRIYRDEPVCVERGEWLDDSYEAIARYLGIDVSSQSAVDYVQFSSPAEAKDACGLGGSETGGGFVGCATDSTVYTSQDLHYHELVHVLTFHALGRAPAVLEEGLANFVGDGPWAEREIVEPGLEVIDWFVDSGFSEGSPTDRFRRYPEAQVFVAYLIRRAGITSFAELYRSLGRTPSRSSVDEAFEAHLGADLATVVGDWIAEGPRTLREASYLVPLCESPALEPGPATLALTCGPHPDPLLPYDGAVRSFDVREGEPGVALRAGSTDDRGSLIVTGCGMEAPSYSTSAEGTRRMLAELGWNIRGDRLLLAGMAPGRYFVEVRTEPGLAPPALARLSREDTILAPNCDAATVLEVDPALGEIDLYAPGDGTRWLGLRASEDTRLSVVTASVDSIGSGLASIEVCEDGCGAPCRFTSVEHSERVDLVAGQTVFVGGRARIDLAFAAVWILVER